MHEGVFDLKEAARRVGVSHHTLRVLVRRRLVPHHRVGRRIIFTAQDVATILKDTEVPVAAREDRGPPLGS